VCLKTRNQVWLIKHIEEILKYNKILKLIYFYESMIKYKMGWFIRMHVPASIAAYTKNEIVLYMKHTRGT